MKFGRFDDVAREYVITQPTTPLPWINYLGSQDYFGLISNTGGGYSFFRDARLRRITRFRYNNVPLDTGGRYIYIRDHGTGIYWSPTWQPVRRDLDSYECRHGLGYTIIESTYKEIKTRLNYFVPLDESLEIWHVTLENEREQGVKLSLFSCVEFCLWDAHDDATNYQRNLNTGEVEIEDGVIYHKTEYRERRNHFAYFASSDASVGYDTQRETFLGKYRGWDQPIAVETGQSGNSKAHGWSPIGSHHVLVELAPGEQKEMVFLLGYHENPPEDKFDPPSTQKINKRTVKPLIEKYGKLEEVDRAFKELQNYWDGLLNTYQVESPDIHTDRMVNIWNAYQCMVTFNLSRSASYFESGIGRGMGYRDSNQDLLGFVHMVADRARERLIDLASTQLINGGAYHQYQPMTKRGNDDVGSNFNDDPAWLVLAVAAYLKETGDWSLLDELIPYENTPGTEESMYQHLKKSVLYTIERLGPNGLPLIGRADWNDCLNLNCFSETPGESFQTTTNREGGIAESVFIAGLFILACDEMIEIANHQGCGNVKEYQGFINATKAAVDQAGWDGAWFRRAYDYFGKPIGSVENDEGKIFIEPQGICIMAGIGLEDGRAEQALNAVNDYLATPHGIVLQQPAFSSYQLHMGEISTYPPGYKENAGIFCHTNPWIMIAETMIGRGNKAFDYYMRINPSNREDISEIHVSEPYVYAQMIAGKDAPSHGEAKNSWLSGTAAWNYVAITQWILGVRPTYDGLKIAPVIPSEWNGFNVVRVWRGNTYKIEVHREGPGNEVKISLNGLSIDGDVVPFAGEEDSPVKIDVVLF